MMNERERMLKKVQMYHFVLDDASLYLDSHPTDQTALEFYKKYNRLSKQAREEFVAKFGPLYKDDLPENATRWNWVDNPWPWDN